MQGSELRYATGTVSRRKRGRKSTIPPEQREEVRRLKKQNMERRRRASISNKLTALHKLAMTLMDEDPAQHQKVEKSEILNVCYHVFHNLVTVVRESPEVHRLVREYGRQLGICRTPEPSPTETHDKVEVTTYQPPSVNSRSPLSSPLNFCNYSLTPPQPSQTRQVHVVPDTLHFTDSGIFNSDSSPFEPVKNGNFSFQMHSPFTVIPQAFHKPSYQSSLLHETSNSSSPHELGVKVAKIWRPYLD